MFETIIFIILLIIVGFVAWKIIKSLIKVVLVCLLIVILLLVGTSFLIYNDLSGITPSENPLLITNVLEDGNISVLLSGDNITQVLPNEDYSARLFVISPVYFESLSYPIIIDEQNYSKDDVSELTKESPVILGKVFNYTLSDKYLYKQYKKGNIQVIPKTIAFKAIDRMPGFLFWIVTLF